jgi:hypothetical protein
MLTMMLSPDDVPNIAPRPLYPVMFASTYPAATASEREYLGVGVGVGVDVAVGVGVGVTVDGGGLGVGVIAGCTGVGED